MSRSSRLVAGVLLILMTAVVYGGASLLSLLIGDPEYAENQLRQDLWRAGHAHAGVVLSLVTLRYVNEASLPESLYATPYRRPFCSRRRSSSTCSRRTRRGRTRRGRTP